jgi:Raf kinase inhibitor-like YbhB/YbcL family protein
LSKLHSKLRLFFVISVALTTAILFTSCGSNKDSNTEFDPESSQIATINMSSSAFEDGDSIPTEYTCDGNNTSIPLRWSDVPDGTRSIAILVDDSDASAGIFRHWYVYNIPSGTRSIPAEQANTIKLNDSIRQASNDFDNIGYSGPCPPVGQEHEYVFFIYALSESLNFNDDATALDVSAALRGKVVGTGSFSGIYARR